MLEAVERTLSPAPAASDYTHRKSSVRGADIKNKLKRVVERTAKILYALTVAPHSASVDRRPAN